MDAPGYRYDAMERCPTVGYNVYTKLSTMTQAGSEQDLCIYRRKSLQH